MSITTEFREALRKILTQNPPKLASSLLLVEKYESGEYSLSELITQMENKLGFSLAAKANIQGVGFSDTTTSAIVDAIEAAGGTVPPTLNKLDIIGDPATTALVTGEKKILGAVNEVANFISGVVTPGSFLPAC